ncbi:hypothetical protein [Aureliella helgolandensis]|uniref:hypothetical protein n=1 Tax=Aureliella helgolandensis TaxID=2527968 RepID=UPI0011AAD832|nr:hypothetical protein [Aureliella helgolandensis]
MRNPPLETPPGCVAACRDGSPQLGGSLIDVLATPLPRSQRRIELSRIAAATNPVWLTALLMLEAILDLPRS